MAEPKSTVTVAVPGLNMDDVFAVSNNEITGNSLVSEVLIGRRNFANWKWSMEMALSARNKLKFVLGDYPRPSDPVLSDKWRRCNDAIMSWIVASVSKGVQSHIKHSKDVMTAWRTLNSRYAGTSASRQFAVERNLRTLKQGELDVADYFDKITKLWEELGSICEFDERVCDEGAGCSRCARLDAAREQSKVIQFLMGLNEIHDQVRSNILGMRNIPDMDVVYDMVTGGHIVVCPKI